MSAPVSGRPPTTSPAASGIAALEKSSPGAMIEARCDDRGRGSGSWDFEGDGTFDYSSPTSPATSFQFTNGGIFAATLRATDDAGLIGVDTVEVVANITASLSIPDDTFDPSRGETAVVRTSISGGVPARVFLKDRTGTTVRTLFEGFRAAGTYDDVWDGHDASGRLLSQQVSKRRIC